MIESINILRRRNVPFERIPKDKQRRKEGEIITAPAAGKTCRLMFTFVAETLWSKRVFP